MFRIHFGSRFSTPAYVLKAWPTPRRHAPSLSLFDAIHFSCFGQPSDTNTRSGLASFIFAITSSFSASDKSRKGGEYLPAIVRAGNSLDAFSTIFSRRSSVEP